MISVKDNKSGRYINNVVYLYYFQIFIGVTLIVVTAGQRCDKGNKVCQKLEADDPVFQGQRCETPADCKGKCIYIDLRVKVYQMNTINF